MTESYPVLQKISATLDSYSIAHVCSYICNDARPFSHARMCDCPKRIKISTNDRVVWIDVKRNIKKFRAAMLPFPIITTAARMQLSFICNEEQVLPTLSLCEHSWRASSPKRPRTTAWGLMIKSSAKVLNRSTAQNKPSDHRCSCPRWLSTSQFNETSAKMLSYSNAAYRVLKHQRSRTPQRHYIIPLCKTSETT